MIETMVRALEKIDRYTWDGAGFDAWLFGILRNVVLEGHRTERRTRRDRSFASDYNSRADGPLEQAVAREEAHDVRSAFFRLTLDEQEVLELRVVAVVAVVAAVAGGTVRALVDADAALVPFV